MPYERRSISAATSCRSASVRVRGSPIAHACQYSVATHSSSRERLAAVAPWIWLDWHQHGATGFPRLYERHGWRPSTRADTERFAAALREQLGEGRVRIGQPHFADRWAAIRAAAAQD